MSAFEQTPSPIHGAPATGNEQYAGELLLDVQDLRVAIPTRAGDVLATDGVSLQLHKGEILGVVGETGSGKSVTCRALLGLRPTPLTRVSGTVSYPAHGV